MSGIFFFLVSSGAEFEIRPLSQWDLGDFFPNLKKKFPISKKKKNGIFTRPPHTELWNPGHLGPGLFQPGSFWPGSFRPFFGVGHFSLGRWVVSAYFMGGSFQPWVILAKAIATNKV